MTFIKLIWSVIGYPTLIFSLLFFFSFLWYQQDPTIPTSSSNRIEDQLVYYQTQRLAHEPAADWLVLGDSSTLMGVDAIFLESLIHQSVQSYATLAWVGLRGFGETLKIYVEKNGVPKNLILLVNLSSLSLDESDFNKYPFESMFVKRAFLRVPASSLREKLRNELYESKFGFGILPGKYGAFYGSGTRLGEDLNEHHGSLMDPNQLKELKHETLADEMTAGVKERLHDFVTLARGYQDQGMKIYLGITPDYNDAKHAKNRVENFKQQLLGEIHHVDFTYLDLDVTLFSLDDFATSSHLNFQGRQKLTKQLRVLLEMD